MSSIPVKIHKGLEIIHRRLSEQGLATTALWLYARGIPAVTGVPILKYSQVTDNLFVGPQYRNLGLSLLGRHGIRAVVNMRIEFDDAANGLAPQHYCYLPTVDDTAPSEAHLDIGVDFIRKMVASGEKVYIHCGAGVGRAPTMAAAYLVSAGYSLAGALNAIRTVRPFIYVMPEQMSSLEAYVIRAAR